MAKLRFRYGAMGASKSANALMVRFNYEERGMKAILLKPSCEKRDGEMKVATRIGLSAECLLAEPFLDKDNDWKADVIIVDEVQFLEPRYIDRLAEIVDERDIPVICYGLRTDFRGELFPASKRLMELSDSIEEIPTICWCGKKAQFNARIDEYGHVEREGRLVVLGANDKYISLCRKHFMTGNTGKKEER